ncbi:DUF1553 domain-containing protein [Ravibacter arvi]|uniref:DUF1553 domain-containing protein n=1 Tax=Ravibacter arvi TaxID=2051041 RepID=A0ABP8LRM7_9BACT
MIRRLLVYFPLLLSLAAIVTLKSCRPKLPEDIEAAYNRLPASVDYNRDIKPILSDKCFACHGPDKAKQKAGLRLDRADDALAELPENPGKFAIVPGKLAKSEFFHRIISEDPEYLMPTPESHLSLTASEKALLIKWIEEGAEYRPHWAFTPIRKPGLPEVRNDSGIANAIDWFIRSGLETKGLSQSPGAPKEILLRRLSLDLTGLPPTTDEMDAFLSDPSENAYEKQVDRLLASPHFGEKLATDWLDLARFADSHGYTVDRLRDMSPYRDWVIRAFNRNMPYDRFITEQLAGDLMPRPTRDQVIATAFNRNHQQNMEGGIIEEEFQTEYVVDRVNTFGDAMLGISLSCAKCHDHKYDPVTQKNYYELFGFFNNVREAGQISWDDALPSPTLLLPTRQQEKWLGEIQKTIAALENELAADKKNLSPSFSAWLATRQYQKLGNEKIPQAGLQAYFDFNHRRLQSELLPGQTGTLKYNGGEVKTAPVYVEREKGGALQMDGDIYLDLGQAGVFRKTEPFSIGIRVWIPKDLREGVIFHKSDFERLYNFRGYHLYLKDGKLEASLAYVAPSNAIMKLSEHQVPAEQWIHLTMTYDGSSRASGLRVYLNGAEIKMSTEIDQLTKDILFTRKVQPGLQIGGWGRGLGLKNGRVDDIAVYSRELTPFEVSVLSGRDSWQSVAPLAADALSATQRASLEEFYASAVSPEIRRKAQLLTQWRSTLADSVQTLKELMVMQEYPRPKQAYVLLRGEYANKGEKVFPNTPASILPFPENLPKNRLGLARWLTLEKNPLTARVAVNRYWQGIFGVGLVKTAEDFGNQGELPTHPELLDWLASEFRSSGWNIKKLHKLMVMSATYRQDSRATEQQREIDPENRFLARGPSRRLTAEMMRDNALTASGLLNRQIGGPSIKPYQPEGLWEINSAKYKRDSGSAVYRRSLYILVKRSVPNPTLQSFDATDRSYCVVRRQQTNTPLQALVTLNDPTFVEAAQKIAVGMSQISDEKEAIQWAYRKSTGRTPTSKELPLLAALYHSTYQKMTAKPAKAKGWLNAGQSAAGKNGDPARLAAFAVVASTILNSDATLTKR